MKCDGCGDYNKGVQYGKCRLCGNKIRASGRATCPLTGARNVPKHMLGRVVHFSIDVVLPCAG